MRLINASKNKVLVSADLVKLLQKHINRGWSRTRQHLDLSILRTICFSMNDVSQIFFCDHGGLVLWKVITIALNCLIEISTVLNYLGELIDRELDIGVSLHNGKYAQMKD